MSKSGTIEAIRKLNPSAKPEFLVEFSLIQLVEYLRQLQSIHKKGTNQLVLPFLPDPELQTV